MMVAHAEGTPMESDATRIVLLLTGMRTNACRERIAEELRRIKGVREVSVSFIRAETTVIFVPPCRAEDLIEAVKAAGYRAST